MVAASTGCPFRDVHERLVAALTENAYLKGKHEARESVTGALVEASAENSKLQTQVELFSEILELKERHAEEKQELVESVVEMQQEFIGELTEAQVENAQLRVQLELVEQRQKLVGEFVAAQLELSRKTAELQTRAAQLEQQFHAIEQVKAENTALKERVAELLGKQPEDQPAAHTATRPTPSAAK